MPTQTSTGTQLSNSAAIASIFNTNMTEVGQVRKLKKKNRQRSSSSLQGFSINPNDTYPSTSPQYNRSASLSAELAGMSLKQSFDQHHSSLPKSSLGLSPSQNAKFPKGEEASLAISKPQGVPWQWLKIRKGIKTKKSISSKGRMPIDGHSMRSVSQGKCLQEEHMSSEDDLLEETDPGRQNIIDFSFGSACLVGQSYQHQQLNKASNNCHSNTSLSIKYQPKLFEDIAGHEIVVKALANAVQKAKIAPLYLFHGPSGTGKTSTARILAMALNCDSSTHTKPCWSCRGCTRSLYTMDLCSGSRVSGFERIRTLMQSTTFTQIVTGWKVFIIEECHLLTADAWEEISTRVERSASPTVVFVMVTEDVNMVPRIISSRCQKFCFPKLKDMDITLKLARMVARENIGMERDALKLIISKADGSMREAENILDQLALLGSRITSPMVQQIVGLAPHNKLLDLLTTVLTADTTKTVRRTRELIASGVQPQTLLSQLASLVTEILSGDSATATTSSPGSSKDKRLSRTGSQLSNDQPERLSHALKMLVETEKQLSCSSDHTNWLVAALLQIASEQVSNKTSSDIVLPADIIIPSSDSKFDSETRQKSINMHKNGLSYLLHHSKSRKYQPLVNTVTEQPDIDAKDTSSTNGSSFRMKQGITGTLERGPSLRQFGDMEEMWQNMLGRIQSGYVKEFLCHQGRLASLTLSSANAIVHLLFKRPDDKLAAQMSEDTITKALENAMGCPVTVNISLDPLQLDIIEGNSVTTTKSIVLDHGNSGKEQTFSPFVPASESPSSSKAGVALRRSKSQKSSIVSEKLRDMKLQGTTQTPQRHKNSTSGGQEASKTRAQQILPFSGPLTQGNNGAASGDHENGLSLQESSPGQRTNVTKPSKSKHRWLSLSSIQQTDASVEQYSQDLLFERANSERVGGKRRTKCHTCASTDNEDQHCQHSATLVRFNRSWSCSEVFCRRDLN